ncbi:thiamine-phosphate kinase [candidate division KSB1 bacterium]|nr:thiamine-phosphate kinase [candidate division KSB1 bacterium]NIR71336.1 thiamine-phosphate kinase [candidate division KSB1 bacterium]NIS26226.1 thiamine-phosphate kinase [candidate division KSB1 bacterium]NIT74656.1 thiamine-phosphate kinase [candidate division KSB1 bacterium]NIU26874.1 thiamine-phosphate kinase [candidate division KSB1 bacterium]
MNIREIGEFGLIEEIKTVVGRPPENVLVGIDDDAAAIELSKQHILLLTTDALIEDVHFNLSYFNFYQLGWRAMAANLSDIAAMGGWPKYALVTLGLPPHTQVENALDLYRGMQRLADSFDIRIVGGDTTHSSERIYISLTVLGEAETDKLTLRAGAQVGDAIFVTGALGGAQAGLKALTSPNISKEGFASAVERHLTPNPRVEEARFLVENFKIHAMIDVSDGLASEINHICKHSGVGAVLHEAAIPMDQATGAVAKHFEENGIEYALYGGEDFELIFTVSENAATELLEKFDATFDSGCAKIGRITAKSRGIVLSKRDGTQTELQRVGYDHFPKK